MTSRHCFQCHQVQRHQNLFISPPGLILRDCLLLLHRQQSSRLDFLCLKNMTGNKADLQKTQDLDGKPSFCWFSYYQEQLGGFFTLADLCEAGYQESCNLPLVQAGLHKCMEEKTSECCWNETKMSIQFEKLLDWKQLSWENTPENNFGCLLTCSCPLLLWKTA